MVTLLNKAHNILVTHRIPNSMPLLKDIMLKIAMLQFEHYDTHKKVGLERRNYITMILVDPPTSQLLVSMEWDTSVSNIGLLDLLFMPHFIQSL